MKNIASVFLSFLLVMFMSTVNGQELTGVEYFWDTDPGFGNGEFIAFDVPSAEINASLDFSTDGLSVGRHILYFRSLNTDGVYGITKSRTIYIPRSLTIAEYFWDADPGEGMGIPVMMYTDENNVEVCDQISSTGLTVGTHQLFVRSKSEDGVWSHPYRTAMSIEANEIPNGCPGDFDYNGVVNTGDLLIFLPQMGTSGDCTYDLTNDLAVNTSDILIMLGSFGTNCE